MKKFFFSLAGFLFFTLSAQAQITINAADITPIGVTAWQSHDTLPDASIQPGGTGMQNWDFTALQDHDRDTLVFSEPSATPYTSAFPSANIAVKFDTAIYIYFEKTDQRLNLLGTYGTLAYDTVEVTTSIHYQPAQSAVRFPATYGDDYPETVRSFAQLSGDMIPISFPFQVDSVRLTTHIERQVKIDAYGQLVTPLGSFETLRSLETESRADSIYFKSGSTWFPYELGDPDTTIYYNWWTNQNGLGFPVVQLQTSPGSSSFEASWLSDYVTGTRDYPQWLSISVSPNPAFNLLTVELPGNFTGRAEVYDLNGQTRMTARLMNSIEKLDVQTLNAGTYILVLRDEKGKMAGFKKFEVIR